MLDQVSYVFHEYLPSIPSFAKFFSDLGKYFLSQREQLNV